MTFTPWQLVALGAPFAVSLLRVLYYVWRVRRGA